jgi:hypothetical protein
LEPCTLNLVICLFLRRSTNPRCTNICPATLRLRDAASTLFSNAHSECLSKTRQTLQSSRSTGTYYGTCANRLPLSPGRDEHRLHTGARFAPCASTLYTPISLPRTFSDRLHFYRAHQLISAHASRCAECSCMCSSCGM